MNSYGFLLFLFVCLFLSSTTAFAKPKGNFAVYTLADGSLSIRGWACEPQYANSLRVDLYVGGTWSEVPITGSMIANQSSEVGVLTACEVSSGNYRFNFVLNRQIRLDKPNQKIYVYAIDPHPPAENPPIMNSGVLKVIPDSGPPIVEQFELSNEVISQPMGSISRFKVFDDLQTAGYLVTETATKPTLTDSRWKTTAPTTYNLSSSTPGTKNIYAWTKDVAGNVSEPYTTKVLLSPILGNIDYFVVNLDGSLSIGGWACMAENNTPIDVHIYAGAPYSKGGRMLKATKANRTSESAVANACRNTGQNHRFLVVLDSTTRRSFSTQKIFVHGIHPSGKDPNPLIANSGKYFIPFDPLATPPNTINVADTGSFMFGTYVFPGWTKGSMVADGWREVQQWPRIVNPPSFADGADQPKRPLLNYSAHSGLFYDDSDPRAVDWMIKWSLESGISLFVYDWYWYGAKDANGKYIPSLQKPLEEAFLKSKYLTKYPDKIHFALLWANHQAWCYFGSSTECPINDNPNDPVRVTAREKNDAMMDYVISNYFKRAQHLKIQGKPAFILWSVENFKLGMTGDLGKNELKATLARWQQKAISEGLSGITLISIGSNAAYIDSGVNSFTVYNYTGYAKSLAQAEGYAITANGQKRWNEAVPSLITNLVSNPKIGYSLPAEKLGKLFQQRWEVDFTTSNNYIPIVSPGWDATPWHCQPVIAFGVTALSNKCVDELIVTHPANRMDYKLDYKYQLILAKNFANKNAILSANLPNGDTQKIILNEAWDEWGEGSVIAPTEKWGFSLLDAVLEVFGK